MHLVWLCASTRRGTDRFDLDKLTATCSLSTRATGSSSPRCGSTASSSSTRSLLARAATSMSSTGRLRSRRLTKSVPPSLEVELEHDIHSSSFEPGTGSQKDGMVLMSLDTVQ